MPFTYSVPVPEGLASSEPLLLKKWLRDPGDFVDIGSALALVQTNHGVFELCANGKGMMHLQNAVEGAEISERGRVCVIAADGEDIPYGRPYSTSRRIE